MPRIRQIKPEFFLDDELAQCPRDARLLFVGLWHLADRSGRLENRPAKIKAQVFPYDSDVSPQKVTSWLHKLAEYFFIILYSSNNHNYIQIRTFIKHQHCHVREPESTIPAPPEAPYKPGSSPVQEPEPGASTVQEPVLHRTSPSASGVLSIDNGFLSTASGERNLEDGGMEDGVKLPAHEKRERQEDPWYVVFKNAHDEKFKAPYQHQKADFVKLASLKKSLSLTNGELPEKWGTACVNFFGSPMGKYTLADLCCRFDVFSAGRLNQYGKPANSGTFDDLESDVNATIARMTARGLLR